MSSPGPLFSIVTPVYEPPLDVLDAAIESVLAQDFDDWELILVDDRSPSEAVRELLRGHAERDPRITLVERADNGHIVAASNDGIALARGTFVVLLDHDDLLAPQALRRNAEEIADRAEVDYLYSDEDKVDEDGTFWGRFHKPDWSPERLRGQMYTSHLSVIRREVLERVGGFRTGFDGSQDHDLALRVGEVAREVVHIPEVLYHWRVIVGSAAADIDAKPYAHEAGKRAVQEHLDRVGIRASVQDGVEAGRYRIVRDLAAEHRVSLVIPTIGQSSSVFGTRRELIVEAVRTALQKTSHGDVEVVVVYDSPTPDGVLDHLRDVAGDSLRLVEFDEPFNYSRKMNVGVLHSTGDRVVFLNDDVEVISHGWLEQLVAPLDETDVGMTGAKLYFADSTIQHAGHGYWGGHYHHPFCFRPGSESGPFGELVVNREVSGVTAACAAMRRDTFDQIGGFAESLPVNFNDVDLSYKVTSAGLRIVWVANCELFHFESQTRERSAHVWERQRVVERWGIPGRDSFTPAPSAWPMLRHPAVFDLEILNR
ncbi:glycosyltransferase family 2 protein [Nocardioides terrigena]|uniref:glycosyltransferase family 2 protein n=1 Tax=Nocardioides terrigena TaxID=424797 RepID=UPI000D3135A5|nr:glycosyltransferase [Nocardioides terrigena]